MNGIGIRFAIHSRRGVNEMKKLILIPVIAISVMIGGGIGYAVNDNPQPNCPTEDSCKIDYMHGKWVITPDIP